MGKPSQPYDQDLPDDQINPYRARHLETATCEVNRPEGRVRVQIDRAESPLAWLARRTDADGRPLIAPEQFVAGERLRAEFTRAQMMPHVTANWSATAASDRRGKGAGSAPLADTVVAARQRVRRALDTVGPEFAGLLIDVCCFLKKLDEVERERRWPARSAKIVLGLGLERLARHYGLRSEARGRAHAAVRTWLAEDAAFTSDAG